MNEKETQEFIESLYENMEEEIKSTYKQKKETRDKLFQKIAMIILIRNVVNDVLSLTDNEYKKEYSTLSALILKLIKTGSQKQVENIESILKDTTEKTFKYYSYNYDLKDVEKIINANFKGKHFSKRVWANEEEVAKTLLKQCQDFLKGKTNVNVIKKLITNTFNTSAFNSKRLVETEVSRCQSAAFDKFCEETGVKKLKYNSILDSKTCNDCEEYNGKIYDFGKHPESPRHPSCRCFYDIVE